MEQLKAVQQEGEKNDASPIYDKISFEVRRQLIKLVVEYNFSVYRASRLLNINNSTAKAIIRKYKASGHIFIRKAQKFRGEFQNNSAHEQNILVGERQQPPQLNQPAVPHPASLYPSMFVYWSPNNFFLPPFRFCGPNYI